jgi:hypothetical protein
MCTQALNLLKTNHPLFPAHFGFLQVYFRLRPVSFGHDHHVLRTGCRKLPTEVFVCQCAKKLLKRGFSTPHHLHPAYATLSRYTFPHPVAVVRPEGLQTPLVVTYQWSRKRKHWQLAPPQRGMPDPGVRQKAVALLLWMSRTPEATQPRGSGQIHPLETLAVQWVLREPCHSACSDREYLSELSEL